MNAITDTEINQSQIEVINNAYEKNKTEWNKLDPDGNWNKDDIEKFARGFEDTKAGQKDLRTIIDLIEGKKLDKDVISTIKNHGLDTIDRNGVIHFNFSENMEAFNAELTRGVDTGSGGTNPLTSNQLRDLQSRRVVQMAEGSLTEIKGGIADARSGGTNPLTSNQLRDLQSGRVVQMAEGSGQILSPLTGTQLMDERSMAEANRAFAEQRDRMAALMG